jgi:hypothetical protein
MNGMMLLTWKKGWKTVNIQIYNLRQRRRETDRGREREGFKKIKTQREWDRQRVQQRHAKIDKKTENKDGE